jgi:hypothetical protein
MRRYKSRVCKIPPDSIGDIFIDAYYWGEGYNPMMLITYDQPEFNIEIEIMNTEEGRAKFRNEELFKHPNLEVFEMNNMP